jgi:hypothetical protein
MSTPTPQPRQPVSLRTLARVEEIGAQDTRAGVWAICYGVNGRYVHTARGVLGMYEGLLSPYLRIKLHWRHIADPSAGKHGRWLCHDCAIAHEGRMRAQGRKVAYLND